MAIVVTGVAGFIGYHVSKASLKKERLLLALITLIPTMINPLR
tara:strand:+ start:712 stop:840 length:129 start_codon:yes stop_codon:yes gene_type:complete